MGSWVRSFRRGAARAVRLAPPGVRRRIPGALTRSVPLSVIVVVTDDNAVLLDQCLDSMRLPAEVLLVVTGASSNTRRVVTAATATTRRILPLEAPDATSAVARNRGAVAASQPYLMFLNAGDLLRPEVLRTMVASLAASGSDLLVTGHEKAASRNTLVTAPEVLARPAVDDRLFTKAFWSGGRGFVEGPLGDWLPAVEAHLRAARFDTVTEAVRQGLVRGGGAAFGAMPVLAPIVADLGGAVDAVLSQLVDPGFTKARSCLLRWLLDSELPRYLDDAERASGSDWAALVDLTRRLRDPCNDSWLLENVGVESRIRLALAAEGRRADLEEYAAARWHREGQYPTEVGGGVVSAVVPATDVDASRVLGRRETALSCTLRGLRAVDPGAIEIEVTAWIQGVGFQHGPAKAAMALVGPSGERLPLDVTPHHEAELNQVARERFQDQAGGLLRARIDPGLVPTPGPWLLEVTLTVAGVTRTTLVSRVDRRGSASSPTIADAVVTSDPQGRVSLRLPPHMAIVRPTGPRLVDFRLDGGDLLLELADAGAATVRLQGPRATLEASPTDGPRRLRLEHDPWGLGMVPIPPGGYRLLLVTGRGSRPLPLDSSLVTRVPETQLSDIYRVRLQLVEGGAALVSLQAPLADDGLGPFGQQTLQRWYVSDEHGLDPRSVYLQSYTGQSATDSPMAIDAVLRRTRPDLTRHWGVADRSTGVPEGAKAVVMRSREWYRVLARSAFVVTNVDLDWWFQKRPGQRVLQTFHGYPSKTMGLAAWETKNFTPRRIERLLRRTSASWDLLLTPSSAMDRHYRTQYRYDGEILARGYPRDDVLVGPEATRLRERARSLIGIRPEQRAVLYAPTWRDDLATDFRAAPMVGGAEVARIAAGLDGDYVILLRGHRFHRRRPERGTARVLDCTEYPEVNDLILAADAAVFDYSSMRFDFALTGRPMVFWVPDLERYVGKVRGFLYDFRETAPGPLVATADEVIEALRDLHALSASYAEPYRRFNETFNAEQDGHASERVVQAFFGPPVR